MAQNTAVEFLKQKLPSLFEHDNNQFYTKLFEQAKAMEKEHKIELLIDFQIFLSKKKLITNHDWDFEKLAKQFIKKELTPKAMKKEIKLKDPNTCEHYKEVGCIKDICTCYTLVKLTPMQQFAEWYNQFIVTYKQQPSRTFVNDKIRELLPLEQKAIENTELHLSQLIQTIDEHLDPLHPIRHSSSYLQLKK